MMTVNNIYHNNTLLWTNQNVFLLAKFTCYLANSSVDTSPCSKSVKQCDKGDRISNSAKTKLCITDH